MKKVILSSMLIVNSFSLAAAQEWCNSNRWSYSNTLKNELAAAKKRGAHAYKACLSEYIQKDMGKKGWPEDRQVPDHMQESMISAEVDAHQECLHGR